MYPLAPRHHHQNSHNNNNNNNNVTNDNYGLKRRTLWHASWMLARPSGDATKR
jgi:hypothetical protein